MSSGGISSISSDMAIGRYVAQRAGIGINALVLEVSIVELEVVKCNTQVLQFNKVYQTVKCCTQNGVFLGIEYVHN